MAQLDFSTVSRSETGHACFQRAIQRFSQETRHSVQTIVFDWNSVWHELVNIAIYHRGADVSEVGSTWVGSLVATNALRPFKPGDVAHLGGTGAYLPAAWQDTSIVGDTRVWSIPFLADVRVVYYWQDMLDRVKVDPHTGFSSPENLHETLEKLTAIIPTPWADVTSPATHDTVYHAGMWLWRQGIDYTAPDGLSTTFTQARAVDSLKAYFCLGRFMPGSKPVASSDLAELFANRQVAAVIAGPWFLATLKENHLSAEQLSRVEVAMPPGPPFVGGLKLVVWQHTLHEPEAVDLIRYLTSPQVQAECAPLAGMLPVRQDAMSAEPFANDSRYGVFIQAMRAGRSIHPIPLWGLVEERLSNALSQVWANIFDQPDRPLEAIISHHMIPLARRLDLTLGG
jgi:multiple sugar transport system substrate-binding protein